MAALTVSAVPAVIDEPGGTLHPLVVQRNSYRSRERELLLYHFS